MSEQLSRPQLVVRIGITGHRKLKDDPHSITGLTAALANVFRVLHAKVNEIHDEDKKSSDLNLYDPHTPPTLRLITGLAAGADQLAAFKALEQGWQLEAVLPFTVDEFGKDFVRATGPTRFGEKLGLPWSDDLAAFQALLEKAQPACIELCGPTEPEELRNRSYLAVGQSIVRRCEVLVAIWDGHEAAGKGGSAEVVEFALRSGTPVIWIDSHAPEKVRWLRIIEDYYKVFQRPDFCPEYSSDHVGSWLSGLLLPAVKSLDSKKRKQVSSALNRFRADLHAEPGVGNAKAAGLFKLVRNTLSKKRSEPSVNSRTPNQLEEYFIKKFNPIDLRADYLADCFRSTYTAIIGLGTLAIVLAIIGVNHFNLVIVVLEAVVLSAIVGLLLNEKWAFYHHRWMDGRIFAELLRVTRWMALLGRELPLEVNAGVGRESMHKADVISENILLKHCFNAIVRAAPVMPLKFDLENLKKISEDICHDLLDDQINYHDVNSGRSHQISHRLENFAYITLGLTILVVGFEIFLAVVMVGPEHPHGLHFPVLGILAGVLPTIAAATAAFRHQSEFELLAVRSKLMANNLKAIKQTLKKSSHDRPWATGLLAEQLIATAELMIADVADWSLVFQVKAVEPA